MCAGLGLVEVIKNLNKDKLVGLEIGCSLGHDYRVIGAVNKAVNEFSSEVNINQIYETQVDVWYWFKP